MDQARTGPATAGALTALGLAAAGAVALAVGDAVWTRVPDSDALPVVALLVGWALLVWAVVLGAVVGAHVLRRGAARQRTAPVDVLALLAGAAVVAAAVSAHPPWGSGSGAG